MAQKKKANSQESTEARLRRELAASRLRETESRAREAATAAILRVIRRSPGDAQPVFEAIASSCEKLFRGSQIGISIVGSDGELHLGAYRGLGRKKFASYFPMPLSRATGAGSAILGKRVMQYADIERKGVSEYVRRSARATGTRSIIFAPMLDKGRGVGAIYVSRNFTGSFAAKESALLQTFAEQAVIAIENARSFRETNEALERQTATAEILRVIGRSMTDSKPVFDEIVKRCSLLFKNSRVTLRLERDGVLEYQASIGEAAKDPVRVDRRSIIGTCVLEGRTIHVGRPEFYPLPPSRLARVSAGARPARSVQAAAATARLIRASDSSRPSSSRLS